MAYRTLFEGSGIHHSNTGLQITPDTYINGCFVLLFDLMPDRATSDSHISHPDNGNIRIEFKFARALPDAITCLLYLEYDGSILIDDSRTLTIDYQWTPDRLYALKRTYIHFSGSFLRTSFRLPFLIGVHL
jgi:hypothetical protein